MIVFLSVKTNPENIWLTKIFKTVANLFCFTSYRGTDSYLKMALRVAWKLTNMTNFPTIIYII